ncbi:unnamed protein product [Symbiodinium sp. CCMP2592]|nr:unnamed protein product [Symbiodinium sp. CCMP2592]
MPLHKSLARNLGAVVQNDEGQTNAGVLGIQKPETGLVRRGAFAGHWREYARGSLLGLRKNLQEGLASGFFGAKLVNNFEDLWSSFDLTSHVELLNLADYPTLERSQETVEQAVKTVLKFARKILDEWHFFAAGYTRRRFQQGGTSILLAVEMGSEVQFHPWRTGTTLVGLNALLESAALVVEGKAAAGLKDVTVSEAVKGAKEALMNNPTAPKHVVSFFTACLVERAEATAKKRASSSGAYTAKVPAIAMDFTPSPKKRKAKKAQIAEEYWTEAKELARQVKHFDRESGKKALETLVQQINALQQKFDDLGSSDFMEFLARKKVEEKIGEHKAALRAGQCVAKLVTHL